MPPLLLRCRTLPELDPPAPVTQTDKWRLQRHDTDDRVDYETYRPYRPYRLNGVNRDVWLRAVNLTGMPEILYGLTVVHGPVVVCVRSCVEEIPLKSRASSPRPS